MYNILFASLPIIWYSVFDFQYDKDEFLKRPLSYKIGLKHKLFGTKVFWQWFSYGALQALILTTICFKSQQFNPLQDGRYFDLWMSGSVVYAGVITIANLKILSSFNAFMVVGELIIFIMIFDYVAVFYIESLIPKVHQLFGTFEIVMNNPPFYLCLIFCVGLLYTFDRFSWITWKFICKLYKRYYRR